MILTDSEYEDFTNIQAIRFSTEEMGGIEGYYFKNLHLEAPNAFTMRMYIESSRHSVRPSSQYHLVVLRIKKSTLCDVFLNREVKSFRRIPYDESIYLEHGSMIKLDEEEIRLSGSFNIEPDFDFKETWDRHMQKDSFNSYNQVWSS